MPFSFEYLRGYQIRAADGDIGSVDDVLFEDTTSVVRYLVVATGSWLLGRKVLLAAAALGPVEHGAGAIATGLTTGQVKDSLSVDVEKPVSRQQEEALHSYYDWPPYWYGTPALGVVAMCDRRTEDSHDAVADVFVDRTVIFLDDTVNETKETA